MNNTLRTNKRILETLMALTVLVLASACSPVRFSQGTKGEKVQASSSGASSSSSSSSGASSSSSSSSGVSSSSSSSSGGGDPFVLIDPVTLENFTFTSIDHPYEQTEFNPSRTDDDTLNFNFRSFNFNGSDTCSVSQIKHEFDPTVEDPATFADFYPAVTSTLNFDLSKAACKAAEISSKIKTLAGGSCTPVLNSLLSTTEFNRLKTIKLTTPKSGGDATYILLEASFLQNPYGNIEAPTINLDANCRCYYTFKTADENYVNTMGLQEHCAAHFTNWNY